MPHRNAVRRSIGSRHPRRPHHRLRVGALAVAMAAAGLAASNAWALTDVCTTSTTTISSSNTGAADEYCVLDTGQSLTVNSGITFTASTVTSVTPAVGVGGQPAGQILNSGTILSPNGDSIPILGTLGNGIVNFASGMIDGAEGIVVGVSGKLQGGLINGGTITTHGTFSCDAIAVRSGGQITGGILNAGTISHCAQTGRRDIRNDGSIDRIDNRQNSRPLELQGNLPGAYGIIVSSTSVFGSMQAFNPVGAMTFGIGPNSTLAVHTYPDVLIGIQAANLTGPLSGQSGNLLWRLVLANAGTGTWDLVVTAVPPSTPIPAIPVWGGAALSALLGLFGALGLRRRQRG